MYKPVGLSEKEVNQRIELGQVNTIEEPISKPLVFIILSNLLDISNAIIFVSIFFLIIYNQADDAFLISVVIFANMLVAIVQETKSRNFLRQISILQRDNIVSIRDGQEVSIAPEQIVLNEIIKLETGKYVYVDGKLLSSEELLIDESILTGESDYIRKEDGDEILSGSFVVVGHGYYEATKIGEDGYLNRITKEAKSYSAQLSPIQDEINRIIKLMTYITIGTIALLLSLNLVTSQYTQVDLVNAVVSIINAMVPQGIVLSLTIAFIIGAYRMTRKQILVQKASTIETLAGINVLCMDKTGTITQNKLELKSLLQLSDQKLINAKTALKSFCDLTVEKNKTILALTNSVDSDALENVEVKKQLPFTSKSKMSGLKILQNNQEFDLLLGSLDSLGVYLTEKQKLELQQTETEFAGKGWRNLIFVGRKGNGKDLSDKSDLYEPLLFISFEDKLRDGAKEIIDLFTKQNIRPIIISGDHPRTLKALSEQLQIPNLNRIITGQELRDADSKDFDELVVSADIFARVTPDQKLQIIKSLQKVYKYVAMIGDGVNDALALKQSNLGIAMGSGASVTKSISDVILMDDNLGKLAEVIAEGKVILANTLRTAQLLIVKNIYSLIIILGSLLFRIDFPFYPLGLFVLSFTNGSLPVLAILADKPLNVSREAVKQTFYQFILVGGLISGVIGLSLLLLWANETELRRETLIFTFLIFVGVVNYIFTIKSSFSIRKFLVPDKRYLVIVIVMALFAAGLSKAPAREFFRFAIVDASIFTTALIAAAIYTLTFRISAQIVANILPKTQ